MIIVMGDSPAEENKAVEYLRAQGYYQELDLVEYHVWLAGARTQEQLEERLAEGISKVNIRKRLEETPLDYDNYLFRLKYLSDTCGPAWFIHDIRPLWFLADFGKLAGGYKIVGIFAADNKDLPKEALSLKAFDEAKISAYLSARQESDVGK